MGLLIATNLLLAALLLDVFVLTLLYPDGHAFSLNIDEGMPVIARSQIHYVIDLLSLNPLGPAIFRIDEAQNGSAYGFGTQYELMVSCKGWRVKDDDEHCLELDNLLKYRAKIGHEYS
ncbi:MAG: hypothetical protein A2176_15825 [Spirochaetes bacterium RBG_13_51_14]|nr:MAG: hypothetical protein A2176_15825 [Spirochaetes bacterium RBG_13_51_14]